MNPDFNSDTISNFIASFANKIFGALNSIQKLILTKWESSGTTLQIMNLDFYN